MKALSIRQPWAWLIVNGYKDIENRGWWSGYRGPLLIHAAKGMTKAEYESCCRLTSAQTIALPKFADLDRGGIVGIATMIDCVKASTSPWFFGKYGFVMADAKPLQFAPFKGLLGFFEVAQPEQP